MCVSILYILADDFDHVFWLGDLNYRLDLEREAVDKYITQRREQDTQWQENGWLVSSHNTISLTSSLSPSASPAA